MLAQLVACYEGTRTGNFTDEKTGRSIDFKQIKVTSIDEDSDGFDDVIFSVPLSFDTSFLKRKEVYIFNIVVPKEQKEKVKFRCVSVVPFSPGK